MASLTYGQMAGTIGQQGYYKLYSDLYNNLLQEQRQLDKIDAQTLRDIELRFDRISKDVSKAISDAQDRQAAASKGSAMANAVMGLHSQYVKLLSLEARVTKDASKTDLDAMELVYDMKKDVEDAYSPESNRKINRIQDGIISMVNTPIKSVNDINDIVQPVKGTIKNITNIGQRGAAVRYVLDAIESQLINQESEKQYLIELETKLLGEFGLQISDIGQATIEQRKQAELALIDAKTPAGFKTTDIVEARKAVGKALKKFEGDDVSKDSAAAAELFTDRDLLQLLTFVDRQQRGLYSDEALVAFARSQNIEPNELKAKFETARDIYQANPEFVPQEYLQIFDPTAQSEIGRLFTLQGRKDRLLTQQRPDLEQLAAQRFISTTPTPSALFTREQRKDLRKGRTPAQIGTDIEVTNRNLTYNLANNQGFRSYYESLTPAQKALQQYRRSIQTVLETLPTDADPKPKGRAEKKAMELYEMAKATGKKLSAEDLLRLTEEAFKNNKDLQDDARTYYIALDTRANRFVAPDVVVTETETTMPTQESIDNFSPPPDRTSLEQQRARALDELSSVDQTPSSIDQALDMLVANMSDEEMETILNKEFPSKIDEEVIPQSKINEAIYNYDNVDDF